MVAAEAVEVEVVLVDIVSSKSTALFPALPRYLPSAICKVVLTLPGVSLAVLVAEGVTASEVVSVALAEAFAVVLFVQSGDKVCI